ncbi:MAG: PmoA family protein [Caldilineaceae bacterium]
MSHLTLTHYVNDALAVGYGDQLLFRYVYQPVMAPSESPKPYFHPMNTLKGNEISCYRPHDHLWHKGLQMTMAHLSGQNFWGGHSYVHGQGYVQRPNNGRMDHVAWEAMDLAPDHLTLQERLTWVTLAGAEWIGETRRMVVHSVDPEASSWTLDYITRLTNIHGEALHFGSPTTAGRPLAGYGGLFWRGPRSFSHGGQVRAAGGLSGEEVMGQAAAWLAFAGKHDGSGDQSTLLFLDHPQNLRYPNKWFIRIQPYACVSFAFMFDEEYALPAGETLTFHYRLIFCDGPRTDEQIEQAAAQWQAGDNN